MKNNCLCDGTLPPVFSVDIILSSITIPYFMHSYNGLVKMKKNDSLQVYEHSTMTRLGAVWGGMLLVVAA